MLSRILCVIFCVSTIPTAVAGALPLMAVVLMFHLLNQISVRCFYKVEGNWDRSWQPKHIWKSRRFLRKQERQLVRLTQKTHQKNKRRSWRQMSAAMCARMRLQSIHKRFVDACNAISEIGTTVKRFKLALCPMVVSYIVPLPAVPPCFFAPASLFRLTPLPLGSLVQCH